MWWSFNKRLKQGLYPAPISRAKQDSSGASWPPLHAIHVTALLLAPCRASSALILERGQVSTWNLLSSGHAGWWGHPAVLICKAR